MKKTLLLNILVGIPKLNFEQKIYLVADKYTKPMFISMMN